MTSGPDTERRLVPATSVLDGLRTLSSVVLPVVAKGPIVRRPGAVGLAERVGADSRAVRQMQRLRGRYGPGPVRVRVPFRELTSTREKRGALGHFQPEGVLVSSPVERQRRRPFNAAVLDADRPLHHLAEPMGAAVRTEAEALLGAAEWRGSLVWEDYATTWWRVVRARAATWCC